MEGTWKLYDMTNSQIGEASNLARAVALAKSLCEFENPVVTAGANGWIVVGVFTPGVPQVGGPNMIIKIEPPTIEPPTELPVP